MTACAATLCDRCRLPGRCTDYQRRPEAHASEASLPQHPERTA